ncbi:MAG TPA: nucleoside deaminase [Reyranella sp.]|nr:nucleoside deaminase [Reyranella sp.]
MISKRTLLIGFGGLVCLPGARPARAALPPISMARHEQAMRLAIAQGRRNPYWPFGAVIVRADTGEVMAEGVNSHDNPVLHGEIVCINDYVARHGNKGWADMVLYTTCEPCPMCITALIWAHIGGVVFGTGNFDGLAKAGLDAIKISARDVIDATPFGPKPMLLGGVLAAETDAMFLNRKRY